MTRGELVFCVCCNRRIPRRREREHHIKAHKLPTTPGPTPHKRPRLAFKAVRTPCDKPEFKKMPAPIREALDQDQGMCAADPGPDMFSIGIEIPGPSTLNGDMHHGGQEDDTQDDTNQILSTCMAQRWTKQHNPSRLQSQPDEDLDKFEQDAGVGNDGNTSDIPLEDGLSSNDSDSDIIDQDVDKSNQQYGSNRGELGEEFELRYAMIGASHFVYPQALTSNDISVTAEKLDEGDHTVCRAFAFKVSTYMTDAAWKKAYLAFRTTPPLPTLPQLRSRITFLAGFSAQMYDCCPNSCVCYTGPHAQATSCTYCGLSRYHPNGKPRKKFTYVPLIPRLQAFCANHKIATTMQYRSSSESGSIQGVIKDVFDSENYKALKSKHIQVDKTVFENQYFDDHRDIALGLSTDGFAPFNRRKSTTWPIIIFNYNLPPEIRFHVSQILALSIIPGPKKPQDFDSFLWPFLQELFSLARGVHTFDVLGGAFFTLRAHLIVVFGDIPAISMVMRMKGHNGASPCRMCKIQGLRTPNQPGTTHYVPLDRSSHPDIQNNQSGDRIKKYNPYNLPLRTHDELLAQAAEVDAAATITTADRLSKEYGIKGTPLLSYIHSLSFPHSFPYDFMHLIWENTIKNLILHWTGEFKALDQGKGTYKLSTAIWEGIGALTASSGSTIPSAYGSRVPNIKKDHSLCTADMWSFWTLYIGPVLLWRRFDDVKYYKHFILLVKLLTTCLKFEIEHEEIDFLRNGFVDWVEKYERYASQNLYCG